MSHTDEEELNYELIKALWAHSQARAQLTKPSRRGRPLTEVVEEIEDTLTARIDKLEQALGVLVNEPTPEQLEKHKMLKEAYKKYKFVEGLVLGDENENLHN